MTTCFGLYLIRPSSDQKFLKRNYKKYNFMLILVYCVKFLFRDF